MCRSIDETVRSFSSAGTVAVLVDWARVGLSEIDPTCGGKQINVVFTGLQKY